MNRQEKEKKVAVYDSLVKGAGFGILTEYGKMQVGDVEEFRQQLKDLDCKAVVMKNTLARIAFEENGISEMSEHLVGPSLYIVGEEEIAPAAKLVQKIKKKHQSMQVKAVLFDGKVYPSTEFTTFTTMPTKQDVRAKFVGVIKAPISQFVRVINAPQRIATVLKAIADKKG